MVLDRVFVSLVLSIRGSFRTCLGLRPDVSCFFFLSLLIRTCRHVKLWILRHDSLLILVPRFFFFFSIVFKSQANLMSFRIWGKKILSRIFRLKFFRKRKEVVIERLVAVDGWIFNESFHLNVNKTEILLVACSSLPYSLSLSCRWSSFALTFLRLLKTNCCILKECQINFKAKHWNIFIGNHSTCFLTLLM